MAAYADDGAWLEAHAAQFAAIQLPRELWKEAARKVRAQIFDGGASLTYAVEADGGWSVVAARDLEGMDVWLVDHVWLVKDAFAAFTQLDAHEELRDRLDSLVRPHGTAPGTYGDAGATLGLLTGLVVCEWLAVVPTASMKAGKHADAGAGDLHVAVLGSA